MNVWIIMFFVFFVQFIDDIDSLINSKKLYCSVWKEIENEIEMNLWHKFRDLGSTNIMTFLVLFNILKIYLY